MLVNGTVSERHARSLAGQTKSGYGGEPPDVSSSTACGIISGGSRAAIGWRMKPPFLDVRK